MNDKQALTDVEIVVLKQLPAGDAIATTMDGDKVYIPVDVRNASDALVGQRRAAKVFPGHHPRHSQYVPFVAAYVGPNGSAAPTAFAQSLPTLVWLIEEDGDAVLSYDPPEPGEEAVTFVKFG